MAAEKAYSVQISGVEDAALKNTLENESLLVQLSDTPPETSTALQRRIEKDIEAFTETMQEHGYFGASVNSSVETSNPKNITIMIKPGPLYTIREFELDWPDGNIVVDKKDIVPPLPEKQAARPDTILSAEQTLLKNMMETGYPLAEISGRQIYVSHDTQTVSVTLTPEPGPRAVYGKTSIEGLKRVEDPFVRRRIQWEEGAVFDISEVNRTRKKLLHSGVISTVDIQYGKIPPDGVMPVTINVRESKHRSVGAGAAYSTTRAFVGNVFWEHRNLFGQAEKFRIKAEGGTETYAFGANFNKPDLFGDEDLSWQSEAEARQESLEAYDKKTALAGTRLNYKYSQTSAVSGGVAIERSLIEEKGEEEETYTLLSFPLTYRFDNTDDLLNPREGIRLSASVTPFQILNGQDSFVRTDNGISHYWEIGEDFVWANRVRGAAIFGQSREDIPADKRLYAGGGGSVRGYGYQMLGPLDENANPTGGRAAYEAGTEGRYMFTDTIEGVAFIEGGQVSEDIEHIADEDFLIGAGIGGRYYTAVGPVRFDVAVPLDKREPDDAFQFYISIGQAF